MSIFFASISGQYSLFISPSKKCLYLSNHLSISTMYLSISTIYLFIYLYRYMYISENQRLSDILRGHGDGTFAERGLVVLIIQDIICFLLS